MCAVHVRVCVLARLPIWRLAQQPSYNYKFTHTHTHTLKDIINEVGWFMQHYMSFSCVCVCVCVALLAPHVRTMTDDSRKTDESHLYLWHGRSGWTSVSAYSLHFIDSSFCSEALSICLHIHLVLSPPPLYISGMMQGITFWMGLIFTDV